MHGSCRRRHRRPCGCGRGGVGAGRTREDVAGVLQVSLKAVDKWWAKWQAGGEALVTRPRGRRVGEHQVLDAVEQQAVRQAVLDHRPCDLGLAGQLWTRAGVGDLIAKLYRVRLTERGRGQEPAPLGPVVPARRDKRGRRAGRRSGPRLAGGEAAGDPSPGRRLRAGRCPSPTRPASVPTRSLAAPGAPRGAVHPDRAPHGQPVLGQRHVRDQHQGPLHFMVFTETFDSDVMCRFWTGSQATSPTGCTSSWTATPRPESPTRIRRARPVRAFDGLAGGCAGHRLDRLAPLVRQPAQVDRSHWC